MRDAAAARVLVEEVSGRRHAGLGSSGPPPRASDVARLERLLRRRLDGEPLQHVLGHWGFRTLDVLTDARALVPRPETEIVVAHALLALDRSRSEAPRAGRDPRALDLGTGSGVIACALATESDDLRVIATDASVEALELATANRDRLPAVVGARIELRLGDWYAPVAGEQFDCVVSNPPYLAYAECDGLDPVVRDHDPHAALFAGPTGLEAIAAVVAGAPEALVEGGTLVVELAPHQRDAARALARKAGAHHVAVEADLAGRDRVLVARW